MIDTEINGNTVVEATTSGNVLTLDQIEQSRDAEYAVVDVPEWGGKLRMASATTDMVVELAKRSETGNVVDGIMELLVKSFVDEQGNRSVTDPTQVIRTVAALKQKEAKVIERLINTLLKLNNIRIKAPGFTSEV